MEVRGPMEVIYFYNMERNWRDHKDRKMMKGKFSEREAEIIKERIQQYINDKDLTEEELLEFISNPVKGRKVGFWTKIADCLPRRSVRSIKMFC